MRHLIFCFCAVLLLTFGPVRVAYAQHWWGHSAPGPMGADADKISKLTWPNVKMMTWPHVEKAPFEKLTPLYTAPKSVGWWHKSPAPMGAGADKINWWTSSWNYKWTWPRFREAQLEEPTPLFTTPKSAGWWDKSFGPAGAGSGEVAK